MLRVHVGIRLSRSFSISIIAIARTVVNLDDSGRYFLHILLCGLALLIPREGGFKGRFGIWPGYLVLSLFGPRSGGLFQKGKGHL